MAQVVEDISFAERADRRLRRKHYEIVPGPEGGRRQLLRRRKIVQVPYEASVRFELMNQRRRDVCRRIGAVMRGGECNQAVDAPGAAQPLKVETGYQSAHGMGDDIDSSALDVFIYFAFETQRDVFDRT